MNESNNVRQSFSHYFQHQRAQKYDDKKLVILPRKEPKFHAGGQSFMFFTFVDLHFIVGIHNFACHLLCSFPQPTQSFFSFCPFRHGCSSVLHARQDFHWTSQRYCFYVRLLKDYPSSTLSPRTQQHDNNMTTTWYDYREKSPTFDIN